MNCGNRLKGRCPALGLERPANQGVELPERGGQQLPQEPHFFLVTSELLMALTRVGPISLWSVRMLLT